MPDSELLKAARDTDAWQDLIVPALIERQQEIFHAMCATPNVRTLTLLQGGAAEIATLLGDPDADAATKARLAEHARNAPDEEIEEDGRGRPDRRSRARRLYDRWAGRE
jgi:hypothetical protein